MPELWYRALTRLVTMVYYRRVHAVHLAPMALDDRPVLFVGLHRNGAVDGMLYKRVFPRAVFLIAHQLVRGRCARLFFTGIPVARAQDERDAHRRRDNPIALAAAVDHLATGGALFVLPEGTSDLGPRHLPFRPGAAKIILDALERGVPPRVVPVGIFYESAPTFRSDVCIVTGAAIDLELDAAYDRSARIGEIMRRITISLEAIAVEAEDADALRRIETLAALADDEMSATRWHVQKTLTQRALPPSIAERWQRVRQDIAERKTAVDRAGVPRFSRHGRLWNSLWMALQLVLVTFAWCANLVPVVGAWYAGRRLADAPNTVALWRMLIGIPLTALWWLAVLMIAWVLRSWSLLAGYLTITALGLVVYPELCVRVPMLLNALRQRSRNDVERIGGWVRAIAEAHRV